MPIVEVVGEFVLRFAFELVVSTVAYYTGAIVLTVLTLGKLGLAPLSSIETTNRANTRWTGWSLWRRTRGDKPALKAEGVCSLGIMIWVAVGVGCYFGFRDGYDSREQPDLRKPALEQSESAVSNALDALSIPDDLCAEAPRD